MMPTRSVYSNPFIVDITGEATGYPGSLTNLSDFRHGVSLNQLRLGAPVFLENAWNGGARIPSEEFVITYESTDTLIVESHGPASLGLESLLIQQKWIVVGSELHLTLTLAAEDTMHVRNDLNVLLGMQDYDMHTL